MTRETQNPILPALAVLAISTVAAGAQATPLTTAAVERTVRAYVADVDAQRTSSVDKRLHKVFRTVVFMPGKDVPMVLTRDAYMGMLKQKKIGGDKRDVVIHAILQAEHSVTVKATYTGAKAVFESTTTWVQTASGLQMSSETVEFAPVKG